jgi:hypothetical protein
VENGKPAKGKAAPAVKGKREGKRAGAKHAPAGKHARTGKHAAAAKHDRAAAAKKRKRR